jgi:FKBP-type peptidyl-prolyl cis-trans isomerase 2
MLRKLVPTIVFAILLCALRAGADDTVVGDGMAVSFEYTVALADKTVVTSNVGKVPLVYQHGQQQILPGLEKALTGMKAGESKHVDLAAADAYGAYDDKAKVTVKRDQVPPDVKADMTLSSPDGRTVKVVEINEQDVVLDLNHPLAGKDLAFDVKIVKVEKAEPAAAPGGELSFRSEGRGGLSTTHPAWGCRSTTSSGERP